MQTLKMFIGGEWVDALSGRTFTTLNPSTGEEIGRVPLADAADVDRAVKAARAAFPAWSKKTQAERSKILVRIAALIREHAEELALMEGMERSSRTRISSCGGAPTS